MDFFHMVKFLAQSQAKSSKSWATILYIGNKCPSLGLAWLSWALAQNQASFVYFIWQLKITKNELDRVDLSVVLLLEKCDTETWDFGSDTPVNFWLHKSKFANFSQNGIFWQICLYFKVKRHLDTKVNYIWKMRTPVNF